MLKAPHAVLCQYPSRSLGYRQHHSVSLIRKFYDQQNPLSTREIPSSSDMRSCRTDETCRSVTEERKNKVAPHTWRSLSLINELDNAIDNDTRKSHMVPSCVKTPWMLETDNLSCLIGINTAQTYGRCEEHLKTQTPATPRVLCSEDDLLL